MKRPLAFAALIIAALALSGCNIYSKTIVDVQSNGSGSIAINVSIDQDALLLLPPGTELIDKKALEGQGWTIKESIDQTGSKRIEAKASFANPKEGSLRLHSLGKPFKNLQLKVQNRVVFYEASITGNVDMTNIANFSDGKQAKALRGISAEFLKSYFANDTNKAALFELELSVNGDTSKTTIALGEKKTVKLSESAITPAVWWLLGVLAAAVVLYLFRPRSMRVHYTRSR